MVWVVRRRGRAEMLLGSDAAKVLKWWKWWKMDSLRGRVGGVESLFTRWQHTRGDARGTDGWRTFFLLPLLPKAGSEKVEFCYAVWGFLQSREWSLWWGSNASRDDVRPVQQWPTNTRPRDQLRVCLIRLIQIGRRPRW